MQPLYHVIQKKQDNSRENIALSLSVSLTVQKDSTVFLGGIPTIGWQ